MVVPEKDCRTFCRIEILTLLMILIRHQMLMAFIKVSIDGFGLDVPTLFDLISQSLHLLHRRILCDDSNTFTDRLGILGHLLGFRQVEFPFWNNLLKSSFRVNDWVARLFIVSKCCQLFSIFIKFRLTTEMMAGIAFLSLANLIGYRLEVLSFPTLVKI